MSTQQYHSSGNLKEDRNIIIVSGREGGQTGKDTDFSSSLIDVGNQQKRCLLLCPVPQHICNSTNLMGSAEVRVQELLNGLSLYLSALRF